MADARTQLLLSFLSDPNPSLSSMMSLRQGLNPQTNSPTTRTTRRSKTTRTPGRRKSRSSTTGIKGSAVKELFWNGPGAVNIKNGKKVGKGFVSGHTDHVHVAAGPRTVDRLGRRAQAMGLRVSENETFDPVDPVHVQGSYHYRDRAIDVSGDTKKMAQFARLVARYQRSK